YAGRRPNPTWAPPMATQRVIVPEPVASPGPGVAWETPTVVPTGVGSRGPAVRPPSAPAAGPRPATQRPRSFADLRTGPLEGRTFASLQQFAVAAVLEGGYSVPTIARLFRIQQWRLQQWVEEAARNPIGGGGRR
uniref:hypothetical protein n=1 Tax=Microbacterium sp. B19 TaxID=96765 RepID=UPI001EF9FDFC